MTAAEQIEALVFATYTKRTGEPSWVFEEFALEVAKIVAQEALKEAAKRCAEIADARAGVCADPDFEFCAQAQCEFVAEEIRREFALEGPCKTR